MKQKNNQYRHELIYTNINGPKIGKKNIKKIEKMLGAHMRYDLNKVLRGPPQRK